MSEGIGRSTPCLEVRGQLFLCQDGFVEDIGAMLTRARLLPEVPRQQRYADRPTLEVLFGSSPPLDKAARDRLISKAHLHYGYSLLAIGKALGLHYTTISKVVKACLADTATVVREKPKQRG